MTKSQLPLFKTETDLVCAIFEMGFTKISIDTKHEPGMDHVGQVYVDADSREMKLVIGRSGDSPREALKEAYKAAEHFRDFENDFKRKQAQAVIDRELGFENCKYGIAPYDPFCRDECPLFEDHARAENEIYRSKLRYQHDIEEEAGEDEPPNDCSSGYDDDNPVCRGCYCNDECIPIGQEEAI